MTWIYQTQRKHHLSLFILLTALIVSLILFGCATPIIPKTNVPTGPSYDQNIANSGVLGISPDGGRIVSTHFADRYNSLIDTYGDQFNPQLKHGDGITCDTVTCVITLQYYVDAGIMIQWKRDGRLPTSAIKKLINKL